MVVIMIGTTAMRLIDSGGGFRGRKGYKSIRMRTSEESIPKPSFSPTSRMSGYTFTSKILVISDGPGTARLFTFGAFCLF